MDGFWLSLLQGVDGMRDLLGIGGGVLWAIFAVSSLMWLLIIERYWFILIRFRRWRATIQADWLAREEHGSWYAHRIRNGLIAEAHNALQQSLGLIRVMTEILPLLGLLGTVSGMIQTFEALNHFGGGNVRGLAGGIGEALITTMAGLITALSGVYFSAHLSRLAGRERERTADLLTFE